MTNEQVNRIENFLESKMSPEEQKRFELDLITDTELAAAYDTYRAVEKYMFSPKQVAREDAVKNTLTELGAEFFGTESKATVGAADRTAQTTVFQTGLHNIAAPASGRIRKMRFTLAAAVVLAVCIIGAWYFWSRDSDLQKQITANPPITRDTAGHQLSKQNNAPETPVMPPLKDTGKKNDAKNQQPGGANKNLQKQLFAAYFRPDTLPANREEPLKAGFELYEREQYKQAADALEDAGLELSVRGEETDRKLARSYAAYYQALSCMTIGEDAQAISLLKGITAPTDLLQAKADWYLALCYVRKNRIQEAMLLLRKVNDNQQAGAYKAAANKLIAEMKK